VKSIQSPSGKTLLIYTFYITFNCHW
jgi:hypothetical protein